MDSSLIHFIPNWIAHRSRSRASSSAPTASPRERAARHSATTAVPLTMEVLNSGSSDNGNSSGASKWQGSVAIGAETGYVEFMGILAGMLRSMGVAEENGPWRVEVEVNFAPRKGILGLRREKRVDLAGLEGWEVVKERLESGRVRDVSVVCWRE